ncbi:DNA repair protein RecO [Listeria weihenstephanensis FSL R9-0317]|uniref:DNA repair protein RecO n=1 Tax=Listeria weihenstephanensis TaxID=1006155 RepID=A0A1S7FUV0_9LIST|nr:DNA repair protein RecO [Listeria weihenstephanensis]AQY51183.1 DNA recombination protein RecO [Listeria weihenstephanensis]EUJ36884.1 DNA repair protein RecO [Listeria weihenstephanensis FSL R9-0317]
MEKCEGIVIRTTDYRESDKIVVIYSREYGKIGLVARGAKKTKSRLAGVTQLFTNGVFTFYPNRGLGTLQQGEAITSFSSIQTDIFLTAYATYACELLDKATEEQQANGYLYELFYQIIHHIDEGYDPQVLTQIFEMKMLPVLGLYPTMDKCAICGQTEGRFDFSAYSNGLVCHRCFERDRYRLHLSENVVKLLRLFYIFQLDRLGNISVKQETKEQLQRAIDTYYEQYSGLYLKSKKFLNNMKNWDELLKTKPEKEDGD